MKFINHLLLLLTVTLSTLNADQHLLRLNVVQGDSFKSECSNRITGHVELPLILNAMIYQYLGIQESEMKITNRWNVEIDGSYLTDLEVGEVNAAGETTFSAKMAEQELRITAELPDVTRFEVMTTQKGTLQKIWVSRDGEELISETIEHIAAEPFSLTLSTEGKIVRVMGMDVQEIVGLALKTIPQTDLSKEDIERFVSQCLNWFAYPEEPVVVGESWNRSVGVKLPEQEGEEVRSKPLEIAVNSSGKVVEMGDSLITYTTDSEQDAPNHFEWGAEFGGAEVTLMLDNRSHGTNMINRVNGMPESVSAKGETIGTVTMMLPQIPGLQAPMAVPFSVETENSMRFIQVHRQHGDEGQS